MSQNSPAPMPTHLVAPHLFVDNAPAAIDFYKKAFGAEEQHRAVAPDGKRLMHASLTINGAMVMLCDDFPEYSGKSRTPKALGGSPVIIHLQVPDVDTLWAQAVAAGAEIEMPLADQFWGDRYGLLRDPYGHTWSLGSPIKKAQ